MNTLLNYPGAKWGMAEQIVSLMPPHRSYLEPFLGSGAVLFNKPPSAIETVNDIDEDMELLEALKQHKGFVILSAYPSEMYERELSGWSKITRKSYNQNADQREEVLWYNFELPGLFDLAEQEVIPNG